MAARIERLVTSGQFTLDGGTWDVDNNVWIIGDDHEAIVIDAAHDADAIAEAVGDRRLTAIVCTHAHNDHIDAAPALADRTGATIWLHPDDLPLWKLTHPDRDPDAHLTDGQVIEAAGADLTVLHTPGHAPGAVCLYDRGLGTVFTGDTLFQGGPGATGRSYSHFPTIVTSIKDRLLTLPPDTKVLTGHGDSTTIGAESPTWRNGSPVATDAVSPADEIVTLHGVTLLRCAPDGPPLDGERAALDLIGDAGWREAQLVAVPAERVSDEFFQLRSGIAGAIVQKFAQYRLRLAVVGDIAQHVADSQALRDLVYESNQGNQLWFLPGYDELDERLRPTG